MQILEELQNAITIQRPKEKVIVYKEGRVTKYFDGFLQIKGLSDVFYHEVLYIYEELPKRTLVVRALVVEATDNSVKALLLENINISVGAKVISKGESLEINIDINKRGVIYDAIANNTTELFNNEDKTEIIDFVTIPIDLSLDKINHNNQGSNNTDNLEEILKTGIVAIDALSPIIKNRSNLIRGQKNTGKTNIALDIILNQKNQNMTCIYCAIGKSRQDIYNFVNTLKKNKIICNIIIITSYSDQRAINHYLAPFIAHSIAKTLLERNQEVVIIYDDFNKHLEAYQQICEFFNVPIEINSIYSKLLDKNPQKSKLGEKNNNLTSLAIIEGLESNRNDNLLKTMCRFTKSQIYLNSLSYKNGIRPAINTSISQSFCLVDNNALNKNAIQIKKDLLLHRELYEYHNSSELNYDNKKNLQHSFVLRRMLIQPINYLLNPACMVARLRLGNTNYLDSSSNQEIDNAFLDLDKNILTIWGEDIENLNNGEWNQKIEEKVDSIIKNLFNIN